MLKMVEKRCSHGIVDERFPLAGARGSSRFWSSDLLGRRLQQYLQTKLFSPKLFVLRCSSLLDIFCSQVIIDALAALPGCSQVNRRCSCSSWLDIFCFRQVAPV
jgi:hypothetical protein